MQESPRKIAALRFPVAAIPEVVGTIVQQARLARRWSQDRLASRAELDRRTVGRIERGRAPSAATVFRLAHALGLEVQELVPAWPEWAMVGAVGRGPRTRERRRALGLTLAQVAAEVGVSEATMSRYERTIGTSRALDTDHTTDDALKETRLALTLGFRDAKDYGRHCLGLDDPAPPADR